MKKAYAKPEIIFESFSLSQNIAAGCEVKTDTQSRGTCGLEWGPDTLFLDSMGDVCTRAGKVTSVGGGSDGEANGICYHVFSTNGINNLFAS